jgi:hypothetical protein
MIKWKNTNIEFDFQKCSSDICNKSEKKPGRKNKYPLVFFIIEKYKSRNYRDNS